MAERVAAFVLARDRTTELQQVLDALGVRRARPTPLIVSNDGTPEVDALIERACAADERVSSARLAQNLGGAGGFSAGIARLADEGEADFIWVFDDDAIPGLDCLERLLDAAREHGHPAAFGAASADPEGKLAWPLVLLDRREAVETLQELREASPRGARRCTRSPGTRCCSRSRRCAPSGRRAPTSTPGTRTSSTGAAAAAGYESLVVHYALVNHPPPPE